MEDFDKAIVPALREALAKNPALETQRRLETLLARARPPSASPDNLRRVRVIQVLERLNSQPSRRLLAELAQGISDAEETVEAQRSLDRLSGQPTQLTFE